MLLAIFCVLSNLTSCSLVIFINFSCIALCKSGKDCSSCCNGAAKVIYGTFKFYFFSYELLLHNSLQIWERLRGSLDDNGRRNTTCPSGLHQDGRCSCESLSMNEESSTRASISRIVMLAEALFEVIFFSELADCL